MLAKIKQIWELGDAIADWILCKTGNHDWTCAIDEGQDKPTEAQIAAGIDGFYDYAKTYCKRCRKISELSSGHW